MAHTKMHNNSNSIVPNNPSHSAPPNTVYSLLLDMVYYELNFGAYWIYLALKRGYLQKHDPADRVCKVPFTDEDIAKIYEMDRRDVLGINRIKLYATEVSEQKYVFYFAEHVSEAQQLHEQIYGYAPSKWHSVYNQLRDRELYYPDYDAFLTFSEMKQRVKEFPHCLGVVRLDGD